MPTSDTLLADKVAIVTGASRGIGAASARAFAAAGAAVALCGRDEDAVAATVASIREAGGTAIGEVADVTDSDAVARLVVRTLHAFGRLDVAFNNAGHGHRPAPLAELSEDDFDEVLAVHARGTFLCLKHEIAAMVRGGGGAIVNMASTAGEQGVAGIAGYVAGKHAVIGLTRVAALDHAAQGIRVNALAPGPIATERIARLDEATRAGIAAAVPLGRLGDPADVAAAAVWLCSDQAGFVSGATLAVDGGRLAGA